MKDDAHIGPRGQNDFVGHVRVMATGPDPTVPVNNIIAKATSTKGEWLEDATSTVGPARAEIRSTYIRWALAINGLHVAAERYSDPAWQGAHGGFYVRSIRASKDGTANVERIAGWDGELAAKNHLGTVPMLVAYGIIDLYACLEEWVFGLYRVFLNTHPERLLQGDEFKELRRLRKEAQSDSEAAAKWNVAWSERLDAWQRKRMYDGLHRVFLTLFSDAQLKVPSTFEKTTPQTWAECIRLVAVLRNSLMHGATTVNAELGRLMGKPHSLGFNLKEGDRLAMELIHLQSIECFMDQLLNAVNQSLVEHPDAFS